MSHDDLPAARPPGAGAQPELRASDADRDRVVEVLRGAAADGRLTAAELDERLGAALGDGHRGLHELLMGSVSSTSATRARCPVLTIHGDTPPPPAR